MQPPQQQTYVSLLEFLEKQMYAHNPNNGYGGPPICFSPASAAVMTRRGVTVDDLYYEADPKAMQFPKNERQLLQEKAGADKVEEAEQTRYAREQQRHLNFLRQLVTDRMEELQQRKLRQQHAEAVKNKWGEGENSNNSHKKVKVEAKDEDEAEKKERVLKQMEKELKHLVQSRAAEEKQRRMFQAQYKAKQEKMNQRQKEQQQQQQHHQLQQSQNHHNNNNSNLKSQGSPMKDTSQSKPVSPSKDVSVRTGKATNEWKNLSEEEFHQELYKNTFSGPQAPPTQPPNTARVGAGVAEPPSSLAKPVVWPPQPHASPVRATNNNNNNDNNSSPLHAAQNNNNNSANNVATVGTGVNGDTSPRHNVNGASVDGTVGGGEGHSIPRPVALTHGQVFKIVQSVLKNKESDEKPKLTDVYKKLPAHDEAAKGRARALFLRELRKQDKASIKEKRLKAKEDYAPKIEDAEKRWQKVKESKKRHERPEEAKKMKEAEMDREQKRQEKLDLDRLLKEERQIELLEKQKEKLSRAKRAEELFKVQAYFTKAYNDEEEQRKQQQVERLRRAQLWKEDQLREKIRQKDERTQAFKDKLTKKTEAVRQCQDSFLIAQQNVRNILRTKSALNSMDAIQNTVKSLGINIVGE